MLNIIKISFVHISFLFKADIVISLSGIPVLKQSNKKFHNVKKKEKYNKKLELLFYMNPFMVHKNSVPF